MYFLNTEMHMVTFLITVFEVVMLVFQIIYFLERPSDKSRLRYLILLVLLILHNICSGLLPDEDYVIPIIIQTIIAYLVAFTMSMYVVYYFYKVFQLKHLRFFATYGLIYFLFLPFILLFVVPFVITGNDRLSAKLTVVIPFLYGLGFIYSSARALILKFTDRADSNLKEDPLYEHAIVAFISMVCWASLPVIVFFGDFQVLEHSVTNAGFLMMTIIYVRSAIKQSRKEYQKLIESEDSLKNLNSDLKNKVKQRTIELEKLIEERKTTFINLAHETKTPLTLIDNYLNEYIKKHGSDQEIQIVKNNIHRLTTDILNFFHIESYEKGFNIYNHDQVSNFSTLLSSKLALFKAFASKRNLDISYSIEPYICIKAHPGAVDRITNNLLENAIKYSQEYSKINIQLYGKDNQIIFSVADNGVGIPLELHEKIFEPYFKLGVPNNAHDGMGMGLSIVKKIVNDLKGEIILNSNLNEGTEISILLPIFKPNNENVCEQIDNNDVQFSYNQILIEESISGKDKPFILIVEDNVEMLNYLVNKIRVNNNVLIARNGNEALTRIEDVSSLDLIISDVMMPDMDGFTFCKTVLGKEKFAHIPFIFLTAKAAEDDRIEGLRLGAVDYIEKPFKIEELLKKIDSLLATLKRQRTAVINKAYQSILSEYSLKQDSATPTRYTFTHNCKKYHLTSREIEIIGLLIKGQPNKLIGDELHISDKTVGKHISNIFTKVGVSNRLELLNKLDAKQQA